MEVSAADALEWSRVRARRPYACMAGWIGAKMKHMLANFAIETEEGSRAKPPLVNSNIEFRCAEIRPSCVKFYSLSNGGSFMAI